METKNQATAAKTETSKAEKTETAPVMKAVKKEEPKKAEKPKAKPINERVQHIQRQASLVEQREELLNYQRDLDSFKFGADSFSQQLHITDGKREFTTTKTVHLEKLVETLLVMVEEKLTEVEAQIQ